jgi:ABC-type sugar transport system substrate-binding protein
VTTPTYGEFMKIAGTRGVAACSAAVVAAALALSACGSSGSSSSSSASAGSSGSTGSTGTGAAASSTGTSSSSSGTGKVPTKTIGVWQSQASGAGEQQTLAAIKAAAKTVGWKLVITDSNGSPSAMSSTMESLINQHVDAILAVYINTGLTATQLATAKADHIPVISVGFQGTPSPNVTAEYAPDQAAMAKLLVARMHKDLPKGGTVAPISVTGYYGLDQQQSVLQKEGPGYGFKVLPVVDVPIDNLFAGTTAAGVNVLNGNPDLAALYSELDVDTQNLVPALAQTGRSVPIYGFGAIPEALKYVREGKATVVTGDNGESGYIAINSLLNYWVNKVPIPKTTPKAYAFKYQIVDKANAPSGSVVYPQSQFAAPFLALWKKKYGI